LRPGPDLHPLARVGQKTELSGGRKGQKSDCGGGKKQGKRVEREGAIRKNRLLKEAKTYWRKFRGRAQKK